MAAVLWTILAVSAVLFILKMAYVVCTAVAAPHTRGALYVSTSRARIEAVMQALPMTPGQQLVDLGCGDGRVLRMVSRRFRAEAVGYELNLLAYLKARCLSWGCRGVAIHRRNFWQADLSRADVVFCYLFPDVMHDVASLLSRALKPGAAVVSCNFPLPGCDPVRVLRPCGGLHSDPIYIYRLKAQPERKDACSCKG